MEGMVLAVEPMLSLGTDQIRTLEDRWTVVTADHTVSAHFEHTIAITEAGPQVLTGVVPGDYDVLPAPVPETSGMP
jgi:methionyl aminopeptidase